MRRILTIVVLAAVSLVGCSASEQSQPSASTGTASNENHAAAKVASDFLSAAVQGDTPSATARLTPRAVQQFDSQDKAFSFPGLEGAKFRIGAVRQPSNSEAVVQCMFDATSPDGTPLSEEICCLMKMVGSEWRVSGIAYDTGSGGSPLILDFESVRPEPPSSPQVVGAPNGTNGQAPQTAQSPSGTQIR